MNTNHHEAIIDRDTFNKVQELFASKQTGKHKTPGLRSEYTRFVYSISHNAFLLKKHNIKEKQQMKYLKMPKQENPILRAFTQETYC